MELTQLPPYDIDSFGSGPIAIPHTPTSACEMQGLAVFPQGALSVAQGLTGMQRWYLRGADHKQLKATLKKICDSHWPGVPDCVPVTVQWGAADDKVQVTGNVGIDQLSDELPAFDQYLIVCQYQLLHISDPWPISGKPAHPNGSVLAYQTRGGAEMLQVDPLAMLYGGSGGRQMASPPSTNSRIIVPLTEYHITCDRLTDKHLCDVMGSGNHPWRKREGTVNFQKFMNEPPGTVMFDTWTLDQTFAPDVNNPRRWRLTAVLKVRNIPGAKGDYPDKWFDFKHPMGWNHDYKLIQQTTTGRMEMGWCFIRMQSPGSTADDGDTPWGNCGTFEVQGKQVQTVPRYPYLDFHNMFCLTDCINGEGPGCQGVTTPAVEEASPSSQSSMDDEIARIIADSHAAKSRKAARQAMELPE